MKTLNAYVLAISLLFMQTAHSFPQHHPVPGGIAVIPLKSQTQPALYYQNNKVLTLLKNNQWVAIVGIPLSAKSGTHKLLDQQTTQVTTFEVSDKTYPAQYITLKKTPKNKRMINPNKMDMERINREKKTLSKALSTWSDTPPQVEFSLPTYGRLSSPFGLKRFFNNQPRKPHSGLDIAAPTSTPVTSPAAGTILDVGDYFFNGNTVLVDHGRGLISGYFHLNKTFVSIGDTVKQGQKIAEIGTTGRVTGAHLHWNIYLNKSKVDPAFFISDHIHKLSKNK